MKKNLILSLFLLSASLGFAQAPTNATVYDCSGNSKNIYATLATGKSVIIAHKGVDCSICVNTAPDWQTWASNNTADVEVWGAITYSYSSSQFALADMCTKTNQWVNTHNWVDIFTFPDSNRLWYNGSSPRYYVYSAIDSSLVYQGSNRVTARNTALAQSVAVGLNQNLLANSKVYVAEQQLQMKNLPSSLRAVALYNLKGQLIIEKRISSENEMINLEGYDSGVYLVQFRSANGSESKKIHIN